MSSSPVPLPVSGQLVLWHASERQTIVLPRESAEWLSHVIEAYDAIPFVWLARDGYVVALWPRPARVSS